MKRLGDIDARRCLSQSQYSPVCVLCLALRAPALMTTCWLRSWPPGPTSRSKISPKSTRKVEEENKSVDQYYYLFMQDACRCRRTVNVKHHSHSAVSCDALVLNVKTVGWGFRRKNLKPIRNQFILTGTPVYQFVSCSGLCRQTCWLFHLLPLVIREKKLPVTLSSGWRWMNEWMNEKNHSNPFSARQRCKMCALKSKSRFTPGAGFIFGRLMQPSCVNGSR